jgi:hypothetical protein
VRQRFRKKVKQALPIARDSGDVGRRSMRVSSSSFTYSALLDLALRSQKSAATQYVQKHPLDPPAPANTACYHFGLLNSASYSHGTMETHVIRVKNGVEEQRFRLCDNMPVAELIAMLSVTFGLETELAGLVTEVSLLLVERHFLLFIYDR